MFLQFFFCTRIARTFNYSLFRNKRLPSHKISVGLSIILVIATILLQGLMIVGSLMESRVRGWAIDVIAYWLFEYVIYDMVMFPLIMWNVGKCSQSVRDTLFKA